MLHQSKFSTIGFKLFVNKRFVNVFRSWDKFKTFGQKINLISRQMAFRQVDNASTYIRAYVMYNAIQTNKFNFHVVKDTHRQKAPSDETSTLSKIMNMDIWLVGTSNQLFIGGS